MRDLTVMVVDKKEAYRRDILFSNDQLEVVRCSWREGESSPTHDHGLSWCTMFVEEGKFKVRTDYGFKTETITLNKGDFLTTPIGGRHDVTCLSQTAQSLHHYSPKLEATDPTLVFSSRKSSELLGDLDIALNNEGVTWGELESSLTKIENSSISTESPLYMNQLFSGIHPQTVLAQLSTSRKRSALYTSIGSPVFTKVEKEVVKALCSLIGWDPRHSEGIPVPGGSTANFMAIHSARYKAAPETKNEGMGDKKFTIYISTEAHYSFKKAVVVLGLGLEAIRTVPVDEDGAMIPEALDQMIQNDLDDKKHPLVIAATAGTTVLGAFDPIRQLSEIGNKYKVWLHVDAAWGAQAFFSKEARKNLDGVSLADSVTFDAHKYLGAHYVSSYFLTRHPENLLLSNDVDGGEYLFHENESIDRGRMSWQCGRGSDALSLWSTWKNLGIEGIGDSVDRFYEIRDQLVDWLSSQPRLKLIAKPNYLNVCIQVLPPFSNAPAEVTMNWSKKVRNTLIDKNQCMLNFSTTPAGLTFIRLVLVNPYLELQHLQQMLTWALEISE